MKLLISLLSLAELFFGMFVVYQFLRHGVSIVVAYWNADLYVLSFVTALIVWMLVCVLVFLVLVLFGRIRSLNPN